MCALPLIGAKHLGHDVKRAPSWIITPSTPPPSLSYIGKPFSIITFKALTQVEAVHENSFFSISICLQSSFLCIICALNFLCYCCIDSISAPFNYVPSWQTSTSPLKWNFEWVAHAFSRKFSTWKRALTVQQLHYFLGHRSITTVNAQLLKTLILFFSKSWYLI